MQIQISEKPINFGLHCLQRQGISGFSRTRVKGTEYSWKFSFHIYKGNNFLTEIFLPPMNLLKNVGGEELIVSFKSTHTLLTEKGGNFFFIISELFPVQVHPVHLNHFVPCIINTKIA